MVPLKPNNLHRQQPQRYKVHHQAFNKVSVSNDYK
jgi:hypothetical protein